MNKSLTQKEIDNLYKSLDYISKDVSVIPLHTLTEDLPIDILRVLELWYKTYDKYARISLSALIDTLKQYIQVIPENMFYYQIDNFITTALVCIEYLYNRCINTCLWNEKPII